MTECFCGPASVIGPVFTFFYVFRFDWYIFAFQQTVYCIQGDIIHEKERQNNIKLSFILYTKYKTGIFFISPGIPVFGFSQRIERCILPY